MGKLVIMDYNSSDITFCDITEKEIEDLDKGEDMEEFAAKKRIYYRASECSYIYGSSINLIIK